MHWTLEASSLVRLGNRLLNYYLCCCKWHVTNSISIDRERLSVSERALDSSGAGEKNWRKNPQIQATKLNKMPFWIDCFAPVRFGIDWTCILKLPAVFRSRSFVPHLHEYTNSGKKSELIVSWYWIEIVNIRARYIIRFNWNFIWNQRLY